MRTARIRHSDRDAVLRAAVARKRRRHRGGDEIIHVDDIGNVAPHRHFGQRLEQHLAHATIRDEVERSSEPARMPLTARAAHAPRGPRPSKHRLGREEEPNRQRVGGCLRTHATIVSGHSTMSQVRATSSAALQPKIAIDSRGSGQPRLRDRREQREHDDWPELTHGQHRDRQRDVRAERIPRQRDVHRDRDEKRGLEPVAVSPGSHLGEIPNSSVRAWTAPRAGPTGRRRGSARPRARSALRARAAGPRRRG